MASPGNFALQDVFNPRTEAFMDWLKRAPGVRVSQKIKIADFRERGAGRGVVAVEDVGEDEELFAIPEGLVLSVSNSTLKDHLQLQNEDLGVWLSLIVTMIHEDLQGPASKWAPYFQVLPEKFDTLMFWTEPELRELQGSSILQNIGKERANEAITQKVIPLILKNPQLFPPPPGLPSFDCVEGRDFLLHTAHRMGTLIMAYAFDIEVDQDNEDEDNGEDGYVTDDEEDTPKGMVPLADILNADAHRNNARLFQEDGYFFMRSIVPIPAGEEIFNDYGEVPRADLLRRYGYITDNYAPYDVVELPLSTITEINALENMSEDCPQLELLDSADALEDGYSLPKSSPDATLEDMIPDDLLVLLRCLNLSTTQLDQFKRKMKLPKPELGVPEATLLVKALHKRQGDYPTTIEHDQAALRDLSPSPEKMLTDFERRQSMAIQVRLGEKQILSQLLSTAEAYISQASQSAGQAKRSTDDISREGKKQKK